MLKKFFKRSAETEIAEHEVVAGTDKPTVILATMVAAKMIQNPKQASVVPGYDNVEVYEFKDAVMRPTVTAKAKRQPQTKVIGGNYVVTGYSLYDFVIHVHATDTEFKLVHEYEKKPLMAAFLKAIELKTKILEQEKEESRQNDALKAIEGLTVKKEPPKLDFKEVDPFDCVECNPPGSESGPAPWRKCSVHNPHPAPKIASKGGKK